MTNFTYNKGACPVCNGKRKDCRESQSPGFNTPLYHCMGGTESDTYKQVGTDKIGFPTWVETNPFYLPAEVLSKRIEIRVEAEAKRAEAAKRKKEELEYRENNLKSGLSELERHEQYSSLLKELGLKEEHRRQLRGRGLTDAQIDANLYASASGNRKLSGTYSPMLPGIITSASGKQSLNCSSDRIACPAKNIHGEIIGIQFRDASGKLDAKYIWASSAAEAKRIAEANKEFYGVPNLQNGELPLNIANPAELGEFDRIGLIEGLLKPDIAAIKWGIPFIGAAGGMHSNSEKQTLEAIAFLQSSGKKGITLFPDGGAVLNGHVMRNYAKTWRLLKENGIEVTVAWYKQIFKSTLDADEVTDEQRQVTEYISWEEFVNIAHHNHSVHAHEQLAPYPSKEELLSGNFDKEEQKQKSENNIVSFSKKDYERLRKWRELIKFTPDYTVNQKQFSYDFQKINLNKIIAIKSGLGTGKTYWCIGLTKHLEMGAEGFLHRNSLCYQTIDRLEAMGLKAYHGNTEDGFKYYQWETMSIIISCIDSLMKFDPASAKGKILFLDEAASVIDHLLSSSTLKLKRKAILKRFEEIVQAAALVVMLDGNLCDSHVKYISDLDPTKKVEKILNEYKPTEEERFQITHIRGSASDEMLDSFTTEQLNDLNNTQVKINLRDNSSLCSAIIRHFERIGITSDSKELLHTLYELQKKDKKCLLLTSQTLEENWLMIEGDPESSVTHFIKNPDTFIEKYQPDVLLYSPTAESGIDISIKDYFKYQYCLFFGNLNAFTYSQMIARLRDPKIQRLVWVYPYLRNQGYDYTSCNIESIRNALFESQQAYAQQLRNEAIASGTLVLDEEAIYDKAIELEKINREKSSAHLRMFAETEGRTRFEKANLRECLIYLLETAGHKVTHQVTAEDSKTSEKVKDKSDEMKTERSRLVSEAAVYSKDEAEKIKSKLVKTSQETLNLQKSFIEFQLPGISSSDYWKENGEDFCHLVMYRDRSWIRHQQNFWLFNHPEIAHKVECDFFKDKIQQAFISSNHYAHIPDTNSTYTKIKLLRDNNFAWFLANTWHTASPEVVKFMEFFNQNHRLFGKEYPVGIPTKKQKKGTKATPEQIASRAIIKLIGDLAEWLGLSIKNGGEGGKRITLEDGTTRNLYRIDPDCLIQQSHKIAQECLTRRYAEWETKNVRTLDIQFEPKAQETQQAQEVKVEVEVEQEVHVETGAEAIALLDAEILEKNGNISTTPFVLWQARLKLARTKGADFVRKLLDFANSVLNIDGDTLLDCLPGELKKWYFNFYLTIFADLAV